MEEKMIKIKGLVLYAACGLFLLGSLSGCGGVSDEQIAQLNQLDREIAELQAKVNSLKSEKSKLEREYNEHKAKLDDCQKMKEQTKQNLEKLPK